MSGNNLFVANTNSGTVGKYDTTTGAAINAGFITGLNKPRGLAVAPPTVANDFNSDGYADLVWENASTGQHTIWFLKNGVLSSFISLPTEPIEWHVEDH